jgi:lactoylglutathione lyase
LGIQQIALGARDKTSHERLWVDLFGLPKVGSHRSEQENVVEDILRCGSGPLAVEVDLMEPLDPNAKPAVHTPALNHVGLWIDDLPAAVAWLEERGVRFAPGGIRLGATGHVVWLSQPKVHDSAPIGGSGVLIELVQAPVEVVEAAQLGQG